VEETLTRRHGRRRPDGCGGMDATREQSHGWRSERVAQQQAGPQPLQSVGPGSGREGRESRAKRQEADRWAFELPNSERWPVALRERAPEYPVAERLRSGVRRMVGTVKDERPIEGFARVLCSVFKGSVILNEVKASPSASEFSRGRADVANRPHFPRPRNVRAVSSMNAHEPT